MALAANIYPKLRAIDIRQIAHEGRPSLLLRDPLRISDRFLVITRALGPALMLCDGNHDRPAIITELRTLLGFPLEPALVDNLIDALDEALLLDNQRFAAARDAAIAEYRSAPFRQPALADQSYPADPAELRRMLDDFLALVGPIEAAPATGWGIFSPHIDYARGGQIYAQVWQRAATLVQQADLLVLIGTDHYSFEPITLTRQHYATPFGILPTDTPIVDALADAIGQEAAFAGELYHRVEHSLELVAVWAQHMRGGAPCPTVPILVGSFARYLAGGNPAADPTITRIVETLRATIAGRKALVVISGDMAHVGPAFGGDPLGGAEKAALRAADQHLIDCMRAGDATGFFRVIADVGDRYNICGLPPLYLALHLMGGGNGELVGYAQCPADDDGTSLVSICGMVFG